MSVLDVARQRYADSMRTLDDMLGQEQPGVVGRDRGEEK